MPYQKSSVNYTIEDHDKHTLGVLREFYGQRGAPTAKADKYLFRIAKIQPETFVDLVCQACFPDCSITTQPFCQGSLGVIVLSKP